MVEQLARTSSEVAPRALWPVSFARKYGGGVNPGPGIASAGHSSDEKGAIPKALSESCVYCSEPWVDSETRFIQPWVTAPINGAPPLNGERCGERTSIVASIIVSAGAAGPCGTDAYALVAMLGPTADTVNIAGGNAVGGCSRF